MSCGFNGKEKDDEVAGVGNEIDYGMRVYDPRIGRFLSVDPLMKQYPELTPYQYASNRPVDGIDRDGLEFTTNGWNFDHMSVFASDKYSKEEKMKFAKQQAVIAGATLTVVTDVLVTRGWLTKTLLMSQVAGAFWHNPASTEEGRKMQDQNSREALSDAFITWGIGKSLGIVFRPILAASEGNAIVKDALKDVQLVVATGDDLAYLKSRNAKAVYMGGQGKDGLIMITEDAPRSHLLEEAIHHQQRLFYGDDYFYSHQAELEVEAQDKLLKIGLKEQWSKEEMNEIMGAKETWEKQLNSKK